MPHESEINISKFNFHLLCVYSSWFASDSSSTSTVGSWFRELRDIIELTITLVIFVSRADMNKTIKLIVRTGYGQGEEFC